MGSFKNNSLLLVALTGLLLVAIIMGGCSSTASTTPTSTTPAPSVELNVSAASSLTDVLKAIDDAYTKANPNVKISANFAASGTLQKQIEQGAPADIFISAGAKQMDALQKENLTVNGTRVNLLKNKVVLVVPADSKLGITSFNDLTKPTVGKVAIGDPASVPAGDYGTQALQALNIYDQVKSYLVLCADVRTVLSYVEQGNVDAGIVYATDAAITDQVKIVAEAPDAINAKIIYPAAVISGSKNVDAANAYLAFLLSDTAKAIFTKFGFVVVGK
jgi:molybdate transport system substrate-binding protein